MLLCSVQLNPWSFFSNYFSLKYERSHSEVMPLMEYLFFLIKNWPTILSIQSLFPPILLLISLTCNLRPSSDDTRSAACETSLVPFTAVLIHCVWSGPLLGVTLSQQLYKKEVLGESAEVVSFVSLFVRINGAVNRYQDPPMWMLQQSSSS